VVKTLVILRRYFLYDRSLLSELSRCAWEALRAFFQEAVPQGDGVPGAVIAIQTFGDFLGFHPHCHVLCTDGCFDGKGLFRVAPRFNPEDLKAIFEHHVFRMLLGKGKITQDLVLMLRSWRHSGFQVFVGPRILPREEEAMSKVIYESKNAQKEKVFDALEWMAAMSSHVPDKGEQMVRYYGYYSNVSRGKRKKRNQDEWIPCILEPEGSSREYRKNWGG